VSFVDVCERFNESYPPKPPKRLLKVDDVRTVVQAWREGKYAGEDCLLDHRWLPWMIGDDGKLKPAWWWIYERSSPETQVAREAWERRQLTPA
jgi:hypothetical protein